MTVWQLPGEEGGGSYFYAEVFQGNYSEDPALPLGVGYLIDFEVDSSTTDS